MSIGQITKEFASKVSHAVSSLLGRSNNSGEVRLISRKEIGELRDLTVPIAEARAAFDTAAERTRKALREVEPASVDNPAHTTNLTYLSETLEELEFGVLSPHATPQTIRAAEAALLSLQTAVSLSGDTAMLDSLRPNDFAQNLAFQATELDRNARLLRAIPGMESAGLKLKVVSNNLRNEVRLNYLQRPIEPYSLKEIGNFRALHFDAASGVVSEILTDLKRAVRSESQHSEEPLNTKALKLQEQIKNLEAYRNSIEELASQSKGDLFQTNISLGLGQKSAKKLLGGRLKSGLRYQVEKSLMRKRGRLGQGFTSDTKLGIKTALASHIDGFLKAQDIKGYSFKDLDAHIAEGFRRGVEAQPWIAIKRDIQLQTPAGGGLRSIRYTNSLTPARDLSPEFAQSYQGIQGVSSLSNAEPRHVVNLWKTEFKPEVGQYSFSGIRHGVHDAFKIKDPQERLAAADRRVNEFIQASVQSAPGLLKKNSDGTYNFDIVSVAVLTPSSINGEDKMLVHQLSAYRRANEAGQTQPLDISIRRDNGETEIVKVRPNIIGFNTGVNSWALSRVPWKAANSVATWRLSERANEPAMRAFIGSDRADQPIGGIVGQAIERLSAQQVSPETSPADRVRLINKLATINQLVSQIREIRNASALSSTSHRQIGDEPYKLPVRLLALANEIGASPAFNCKSGKDRTGQLDVEVKDFYSYLNAWDGEVRDINHKRRDAEVDNFRKIFEQSGTREIQKFNTSIPGSKVDLKLYWDLLGYEKNEIDNLQGLSQWVGA